MRKYQNGSSSSNPPPPHNIYGSFIPKPEILDFSFPSDRAIYSTQPPDNAAAGSSSRSHVRSSLVEMGFSLTLVEKVIDEHGEDNIDLLVEILMESSIPQKSNSQQSLDALFGDVDMSKPPEFSLFVEPKEEPFEDGKRASLLQMNFSAEEVDFAMTRLGMDAPVDEIVDFITATQVAETAEEELEHGTEQNEDITNEALFGTMDKTLQLLEMGFSENEISLAIERFGSELPVLELANSICAEQAGETYIPEVKRSSKLSAIASHVASSDRSANMEIAHDRRRLSNGRKTPADLGGGAAFRSRNRSSDLIHRGKRQKKEFGEGCSNDQSGHFGFEDNCEEEKPEYTPDFSFSFEPMVEEEKPHTQMSGFGIPRAPKSNSCRIIDRMIAKPPYFFYGNVASVSLDTWGKISQFLYGVEPEFVGTQFFSALSRKEGYVHNLPVENRFHILPKPPTTIEDAMPHTKKWWPSWDKRKQFSSINIQTNGVSQLCDRLGRMLIDSRGLISDQQKKEILCHCLNLNLVWVGLHKMRPIEVENLELILGYPMNHTQTSGCSLSERLHALRYSFQIDTLGYHLSVLKSMYPEGITMLSIFSGIGGAGVALHRLGIHMKGVVSVETSETKRKMLRTWWENSSQTGELEQIDCIQKLTIRKVDGLIEKFGDFDLIVCESPCTFSSGNLKTALGEGHGPSGFDFSTFCEFVRVLQRVRDRIQRKR